MRFEKLKKDILGKQYSLSIAFVPPEKSRELNKKYRGKNKPTNVLAFPLRKNEGEIILCPSVIKNEIKNQPKNFKRTYKEWEGFLVIHGMLHLKGMTHGSTMDKAEITYDQKYFHRNRRRVPNDKSRRGRVLKRRKKS